MAVALPFIALGALAIGTGMSVYGTLAQGAHEARVAKAQAQISELQAKTEGESADANANQLRQKAREMVSYQRAAYGASGFDMSGSPMLTVAQTLHDSGRDIANLYKQSNARQLAYKTQAGIYADAGSYAQTASYWRAGSSLLTSVGQGISTWKGLSETSTPASNTSSRWSNTIAI